MLDTSGILDNHLRKLGESNLSFELKDTEYSEIERLISSIPKKKFKQILEELNRDVYSILIRDLNLESVNIIKHALSILSVVLEIKWGVIRDKQTLIRRLIKIAIKNTSPSTNLQLSCDALKCIRYVIDSKVVLEHDILPLKSFIAEQLDVSTKIPESVVIESLLLFKVMLEYNLWDCKANTNNLLKCLLDRMFGKNADVRATAIAAFDVFKPYLTGKEGYLDEMENSLIKSKFSKFLIELLPVDKNWAVMWRLLLELMGKRFHHNSTLVNSLLAVEEKAFKSSNMETKKEAFINWKSVILSFSSDHSVLTSERRVKLLAIPLRANNCRSLEIAMVKFDVWWYLLVKMRSGVSRYPEVVLTPFLKFCFGPFSDASLSSANGQNMLNNTNNGEALGRLYSVLRIPCLQALAQILCVSAGSALPPKLNKALVIMPISDPVLPSGKDICCVSRILTQCVGEAMLLTSELQFPWIVEAWRSLLILVNRGTMGTSSLVDDASSKDVKQVSMLKELLRLLVNLVDAVLTIPDSKIYGRLLLSMIECLTMGDACLHPTVLNSHVFAVGSSQVMNGSPTLLLATLLLSPTLLNSKTDQTRYMEVFSNLLTLGFNSLAPPLSFARTLLKKLDALMASEQMQSDCLSCAKQIWILIVNHLYNAIEKNNCISEGDDALHDFQCIYGMLMFPIAHFLKNDQEKEPSDFLLKPWEKLFKQFYINSQFLITVQHYEVIEELCKKILVYVKKGTLSLNYVTRLTEYVSIIYNVNSFEEHWKEAKSSTSKGDRSTFFPSQQLLYMLFYKVCDFMPLSNGEDENIEKHTSIISYLILMFSIALRLDLMGFLIEKGIVSVGYYMKLTAGNMKYQKNLEKEMVKLWEKFLEYVGKKVRLAKGKGQHHIDNFLPLLEEGFTHPIEKIVEVTKSHWNKTLGEGCSKLTIPKSFSDILDNVLKDTGGSAEPDFMIIKEKVISPFKRPIRKSSLSGEKKAIPTSPLRSSNNQGNSVEFVAISPRNKSPILTEHQKEKLKSRRVDIPALYQDLTQDSASQSYSQDIAAPILDPPVIDISEDANPPFPKVPSKKDKLPTDIGSQSRNIPNVADGTKSAALQEEEKNESSSVTEEAVTDLVNRRRKQVLVAKPFEASVKVDELLSNAKAITQKREGAALNLSDSSLKENKAYGTKSAALQEEEKNESSSVTEEAVTDLVNRRRKQVLVAKPFEASVKVDELLSNAKAITEKREGAALNLSDSSLKENKAYGTKSAALQEEEKNENSSVTEEAVTDLVNRRRKQVLVAKPFEASVTVDELLSNAKAITEKREGAALNLSDSSLKENKAPESTESSIQSEVKHVDITTATLVNKVTKVLEHSVVEGSSSDMVGESKDATLPEVVADATIKTYGCNKKAKVRDSSKETVVPNLAGDASAVAQDRSLSTEGIKEKLVSNDSEALLKKENDKAVGAEEKAVACESPKMSLGGESAKNSPILKSGRLRKSLRPRQSNSPTSFLQDSDKKTEVLAKGPVSGDVVKKRGRPKRIATPSPLSTEKVAEALNKLKSTEMEKIESTPKNEIPEACEVEKDDKELVAAEMTDIGTISVANNEVDTSKNQEGNNIMSKKMDPEGVESVKEIVKEDSTACDSPKKLPSKALQSPVKDLAKDTYSCSLSPKPKLSLESPKHKSPVKSRSLDEWIIVKKRDSAGKSEKTESAKTDIPVSPKTVEDVSTVSNTPKGVCVSPPEDFVDSSQEPVFSPVQGMTKQCSVNLARMSGGILSSEVAFISYEGTVIKCHLSPPKKEEGKTEGELRKMVNGGAVTNLFSSHRSNTGRGARLLNLAQSSKEEGVHSPLRDPDTKPLSSLQGSPVQFRVVEGECSTPPAKKARRIKPLQIGGFSPQYRSLEIGCVVSDGDITIHDYSPNASPKGSLMKKRKTLQETDEDSPSSAKKSRRVSFADPIVSKHVEFCIPESERKFKKRAVSRCLKMLGEPDDEEMDQNNLSHSETEEAEPAVDSTELGVSPAESPLPSIEKSKDLQESNSIEELEVKPCSKLPESDTCGAVTCSMETNLENVQLSTTGTSKVLSTTEKTSSKEPSLSDKEGEDACVEESSIDKQTKALPPSPNDENLPQVEVSVMEEQISKPTSDISNKDSISSEEELVAASGDCVEPMEECSNETVYAQKVIDTEPVGEAVEASKMLTPTKMPTTNQLEEEACPELRDCSDPIDDETLCKLTSRYWRERCKALLTTRNIHTIGDLSRLTEVKLVEIPFKLKKWKTLVDTLNDYRESGAKKAVPDVTTGIDSELVKEKEISSNMKLFREILSKLSPKEIARELQSSSSAEEVTSHLMQSTSASLPAPQTVCIKKFKSFASQVAMTESPKDMLLSLVKEGKLRKTLAEMHDDERMMLLKCVSSVIKDKALSSNHLVEIAIRDILCCIIGEFTNENNNSDNQLSWLFQKCFCINEQMECISSFMSNVDSELMSKFILADENIMGNVKDLISPSQALQIAVHSLSKSDSSLPLCEVNQLDEILDKHRSNEDLVNRFSNKILQRLSNNHDGH